MFTIPFIVHKRLMFIFLLLLLIILFRSIGSVSATEVLKIQIDPPSPAYNQPFKCTLTLDQDDHRNACDLLPLDAGPDDRPWDICRIDHISNDATVRYYNCIANADRHVPGPGQYQLVVWNFTGDGETGQVIARQNITILASLPPSPTKTPKPTSTPYIPPTSAPLPTPYPTQQLQPTLRPTSIVVHPTQSVEYVYPTPFPTTREIRTNKPDLSLKLFDDVGSSLSSLLQNSLSRTQNSVLAPFWDIIVRFLEETHF